MGAGTLLQKGSSRKRSSTTTMRLSTSRSRGKEDAVVRFSFEMLESLREVIEEENEELPQ
jgi:hypothetical protein